MQNVKSLISAAVVSAGLVGLSASAQAATVSADAVLKNYANIAHSMYQDALDSAVSMEKVFEDFLANPNAESLRRARAAWIAARVPYQQTEGFRFGNAWVDDWEGRVNAWPLDEGLIDYVAADYGNESEENPAYVANVIANKMIQMGGQKIDATNITKDLLRSKLHEAEEVEANVATGYHAVEFLLWGQDLNGTKAGAGNRPATDFDLKNCTGGNCERRRDYLMVSTALLIDDLSEAVAAWAPKGEAYAQLMAKGEKAGLSTILTGLGSLSYGELAGERTKLGLMLHDPEEEHDCFADNTHNSHYYNQIGMLAIYNGHYARTDGSVVSGPSISDMVRAASTDTDRMIQQKMSETRQALGVMKDLGDRREYAFDQLIAENSAFGNKVVQTVVDSLKNQTKAIEKAVSTLSLNAIEFEGSDSLDNPSAVMN